MNAPEHAPVSQGALVNRRGIPGVASLRMVLAILLSALVTDVRAARIRDEAVHMVEDTEDE